MAKYRCTYSPAGSVLSRMREKTSAPSPGNGSSSIAAARTEKRTPIWRSNSLRRGDATTEEILVRQRELATGYQYEIGFGISYSFGSIFNNVVNPRFRNVGGW